MITLLAVGVIAAVVTALIAYEGQKQKDPMVLDNKAIIQVIATQNEKQYRKIKESYRKSINV